MPRQSSIVYPAFATQLLEQHRNIERVLILIRLQVDSLRPVNGARDLHLIDRAITYMSGFPSQVHDPSEDLLLDRLVQRAPASAPLCERLAQQQDTFSAVQSALLGHVRRARSGDDRAHKSVREAGVAYCLQYADHIHSEETDMLPAARHKLTRDDWEDVGRQANYTFAGDVHPELKTHDSLYDFLMAGEAYDDD
jgi:hemerythrin-like domain-containing protein